MLVRWLLQQVTDCAQASASDPTLDPLTALEALEVQACQRAWRALPTPMRARLEEALQEAMSSTHAVEAGDRVRSLRSVSWRLLREELQLPPLELNFHDGW